MPQVPATTLERTALQAKLVALIEEAVCCEVEVNIFQPRTVGDTKTLVVSWRPSGLQVAVEHHLVMEDPVEKLRRLSQSQPYRPDVLAPQVAELYDPAKDMQEYEEELPRVTVELDESVQAIPKPPVKRRPGRPSTKPDQRYEEVG